MPAAARKGDSGVVHCSGYVIATASNNVIINGRGAARINDVSTTHLKPGGKRCVAHRAPIVTGSKTVFVNSRPAATVGSKLSGCTSIATGSNNVIIG